MNRQRPVNLNLLSIRFPVTSISSISHRVTGVFLFIGVFVLLWLFGLSLESKQGFQSANEFIHSTFGRLLFWAILSSIAFHLIAGVRHLFMDAGIGESLEGGILGARLVLILGAVAAVLIGVWLW